MIIVTLVSVGAVCVLIEKVVAYFSTLRAINSFMISLVPA